jgi:hypothetical protein
MSKSLVILFALAVCGCTSPKYPPVVKMVCFPFRTHTIVSVNENNFEAIAAPNDLFMIKTSFTEITNPAEVKKIVDLLKTVTNRKQAHLDDVSFRASIALDGETDKYYFNWDKKHIVYKLKNYAISRTEFDEFKKITNMCSD